MTLATKMQWITIIIQTVILILFVTMNIQIMERRENDDKQFHEQMIKIAENRGYLRALADLHREPR